MRQDYLPVLSNAKLSFLFPFDGEFVAQAPSTLLNDQTMGLTIQSVLNEASYYKSGRHLSMNTER